MTPVSKKSGKISNNALIVGGVLLLLLIIGAALILWPQPTPTPPTKCADSDAGKNVLEAGNTTLDSVKRSDSCVNSSHVLEYFCSNGNISNATMACPGGYACSNGACNAVAKPAACTETDAGKDVFSSGKTTEGNVTKTDSCKNSTSIIEYYCLNDSTKAAVTSCPAGYICSNGACSLNTTPVSACHDSDGKSYFMTGAVFKDNKNYEDYCVDIFTVKEQYCENGDLKNVDYVCPTDYECYDGRCAQIPTSCTDSDNGKNKGQKGVTTLKSGPELIDEDIDVCVAPNKVAEFYCVNSKQIADEVLECGKDEECVDGACIAVAKPTCQDSDGGQDLNLVGTATDATGTYKDSCDGSDVKEYYCDGDTAKSINIACPSGQTCLNGECALIMMPLTCNDSDAGKDYTTAGSVYDGVQTFKDSCQGTKLTEYYCNGTTPTTWPVDCLEVAMTCLNGACVKSTTCTDTDTGQNIMKAGTASDIVTTKSDTCPNTSTVTEYYCDTNNLVKQLNFPCPSGYGCFNGQCELKCTDSDGGEKITVKGTTAKGTASYTDDCIDSSNIIEYYCSASNKIMNSTQSCGLGYWCIYKSGACTKKPPCKDNDGGKNTLVASNASSAVSTYYDGCNLTDSNYVFEAYCDANEDVQYEHIKCPSGTTCSMGACAFTAIVTTFCTDSDGGTDEHVKGTVTDWSGTYTDTCAPTAGYVREYFCKNTTDYDYWDIYCGAGSTCVNGVCTP